MTEEQRARLLALLQVITGAQETALGFVLDSVADKALNYCNRDDVPPRMENLIVEMAAETYRAGETEGNAVESIREGDVTVTYGGDRYNAQTGAGGADFLKNHRAQLARLGVPG